MQHSAGYGSIPCVTITSRKDQRPTAIFCEARIGAEYITADREIAGTDIEDSRRGHIDGRAAKSQVIGTCKSEIAIPYLGIHVDGLGTSACVINGAAIDLEYAGADCVIIIQSQRAGVQNGISRVAIGSREDESARAVFSDSTGSSCGCSGQG